VIVNWQNLNLCIMHSVFSQEHFDGKVCIIVIALQYNFYDTVNYSLMLTVACYISYFNIGTETDCLDSFLRFNLYSQFEIIKCY